jgi:hypothetical protein
MIKISIKYIHKNRAPLSQKIDSEIKHFYERSFFDNVDIQKHAALWNVTLEFHPRI